MHTPEYALLNTITGPGRVETASANLPVISEDDATPEVASLYAHFRSHFGRQSVPGILQCFATHPPLLRHMMALSETMLFADGALGRQQKELIATFVSAQNRCAYCADSHGFFLGVHGGSPELLNAALSCNSASASMTAAQSALLKFAEKVNENAEGITASDIDRLRSHAWNDLQIAETIHLTALFAVFNRVANAFGLPSQGLLARERPPVP